MRTTDAQPEHFPRGLPPRRHYTTPPRGEVALRSDEPQHAPRFRESEPRREFHHEFGEGEHGRVDLYEEWLASGDGGED